jgi:thiol:disulfide interchange protein
VGGVNFAAAAIAISVALVVVLAFAGKGQRRGRAVMAWTLPATLLLGATAFAGAPQMAMQKAGESGGVLGAEPFSEEALAQARKEGKPVFAYFTADWCLSCKVNEGTSIERESTKAAFEKAGAVVLVGDWTRRDPAITKFLTAQGAAGVPLYLWYPAGGGEPKQLPQVLTPDLLAGLPTNQAWAH